MRLVDLAIILAYLAGITWFGARFRSGQKNLRDYFLGGRTAPWWAISLSIVSAETSTLTIVGTPALAFGGNLGFLQIVLGYLLARIAISVLLLPQYFRGEMFTAYELMRRRFGERIRKLTASIFLLTRTLAEGVRVAGVAIVISVVLGTGETVSIVLIVLLTLFYTFEGGMTAVIWTDVVQMSLYVVGAMVSFFVILGQIHGGWSHVMAVAALTHKMAIFDFRFAFTMEFFARKYSFWAGLAGGCFLTTASHGTDQLMVQRLLSARDERQSRTALMASWVVVAFQFTLFLLIGLLPFVAGLALAQVLACCGAAVAVIGRDGPDEAMSEGDTFGFHRQRFDIHLPRHMKLRDFRQRFLHLRNEANPGRRKGSPTSVSAARSVRAPRF